MGLPAALRQGGQFTFGTFYEVYLKKDYYFDESGKRLPIEHWVMSINKTEMLRGKERVFPQLVYFTDEQVKRRVYEKFQNIPEGQLIGVPIMIGNYKRALLLSDDVLSLAE